MYKDEKHIIVCDLDGTLLTSEKLISGRTRDYLIQLQKQGHILVIASGRFYHEIITYATQLQLMDYGGYVICGNGLEIYHKYQCVHEFSKLSQSEVKSVLQEARKAHVCVHLHMNSQYYATCGKLLNGIGAMAVAISHCFPTSKNFYLQSLRQFHFLTSMDAYIKEPVAKLCFFSTPRRIRKFVNYLHIAYPHSFQTYHLHHHAIELVKKDVGKDIAVQWVCDDSHYHMNQVIAFGDSGNDEALLATAGIGVTMKNGYRPVVKKARLLSHKTNNEDGVMHMLQSLLR